MSIKQFIRAWRWKRAVKQANELAALTKKKYFVLSVGGRFQVISKQEVGVMIRKHSFCKGLRMADIENKALYITL